MVFLYFYLFIYCLISSLFSTNIQHWNYIDTKPTALNKTCTVLGEIQKYEEVRLFHTFSCEMKVVVYNGSSTPQKMWGQLEVLCRGEYRDFNPMNAYKYLSPQRCTESDRRRQGHILCETGSRYLLQVSLQRQVLIWWKYFLMYCILSFVVGNFDSR